MLEFVYMSHFCSQAYLDPEIETIHVSSLTIFKAVLALASANFILLLVWSLVAPLEWTRVVTDATDNFDRNIESYANCAASDQSLVFVVIILLANIAFLVVGTFWAYKSRNIATEYNESRYIGMSIVAVLQSWTIGLPILIVVRDNPSANFYVQSGLIFVTALAIVAFTFVPKMIALHKEASGSKKRQKLYREFVREASLRRRAEEEHSDRDPHVGFDDFGPHADDSQGDTDRPKQGIKIIHNPRVSLLTSVM
jgi:7 transmembrane sweet-taste receptor of 3 GCPR